jgi:hypothetical protein
MGHARKGPPDGWLHSGWAAASQLGALGVCPNLLGWATPFLGGPRTSRVCMHIAPQENDFRVVPCVVLCDLSLWGFEVGVGCVSDVANVCCVIYGWDLGYGLF